MGSEEPASGPQPAAVNDGESQWLRTESGLRPADGAIDDRSAVALLQFAPELGALLRFYDLHDHASGDWTDFFLADPTMVVASIAAVDLRALDRRFESLSTALAHASSAPREPVHAMVDFVVGVARSVARWARMLEAAPSSARVRALSADLHASIRQELRGPLRSLAALDRGAARSRPLGSAPLDLDYDAFDGVWGLSSAEPSALPGASTQEVLDEVVDRSRSAFDALALVLGRARAQAVAAADEQPPTGRTRPQLALYQAFVALFRRAQDAINSLGQRYPRFYYRDVLRMRPKAAESDRVYLDFVLAADDALRRATVAKGTQFSGGQDEAGNELLYATEQGLVVTTAELQAVCTLRVLRQILPLDEGDEGEGVEPWRRLPLELLASEVDLEALAGDDPAQTGRTEGFATFGPATTGQTAFETTTRARIGFALASSSLGLSGGERTVKLRVRYQLSPVLARRLRALADAAGIERRGELLRQVLGRSLALAVTTEEGWLAVREYAVEGEGDHAFVLCFTLPASVAAVTSLPAEEEADGEAELPLSSEPMVRALIDQSPISVGDLAELYPLSALEGLLVEQILLTTEVQGVGDLQLENTDGEIDPSSPFPVFGGAVVQGSYLRIRSTELFDRRIDHLWIGIQWFDLPSDAEGFYGYYRGYVLGPDGKVHEDLFTNDVFRFDLSEQIGYPWTFAGPTQAPSSSEAQASAAEQPPEASTQSLRDQYLFRTRLTRPGQPPKPKKRLVEHTRLEPRVMSAEAERDYYDPADNALQITLSQPPYAFGDSLYSANVLRAVVDYLPVCVEGTAGAEALYLPLETAARIVAEGRTVGLERRAAYLFTGLDLLHEAIDERLAKTEPPPAVRQRHEALRRAHAAWQQLPLVPASEGASEGLQRWMAGAEAYRRAVSELGDELKQARVFPETLPLIGGLFYVSNAVLACASGEDDDAGSRASARLLELYTTSMMRQLTEPCDRPETLDYPNPPYLPQARAVTVGYVARATLFGDPQGADQGTLLHLLPFGGHAVVSPQPSSPPSLFPHFAFDGSLELGFGGLDSGTPLTVLLSMGGERGAATGEGPQWERLDTAGWQPLPETALVEDGTGGLRSTGILGLRSVGTLGRSSQKPGSLHWLRAVVGAQAETAPQTLMLWPHAVEARSQGTAEDPAARYHRLPAHTVTTPIEDLAEIDAVDQPLASFGGRPAQNPSTFWLAAGERLRHKSRAILPWDYQRLVLERFPWVWKVGVRSAHGLLEPQQPGQVLVVVVPGPDTTTVEDPTVPVSSPEQLQAIAEALGERATPFATIHVVDPNYLRLEVQTEVVMADEGDADALVDRLDAELVEYLSPWFYDASREAKGGDYVEIEEIESFIQSRPYVRWVQSISLSSAPGPGYQADARWAFYTSATSHRITAVPDEGDACMPAR